MREAAFNRFGLAGKVTTQRGEPEVMPVRYRTIDVEGLDVFYRETGNPEAPGLLLLHGFPSSSHMFRDLLPRLADRFHAIAPDLPGFGRTAMPSRDDRPRLLAVWGKNDPFFLPAGAEAFKRDIPEADIRFLETGHFALETHAEPIAAAIREFLAG